MTILSIQHLNFGFRGQTLFKDAQMTIPLPGIFGLAAPAGSGKTTLFNLISGLRRQSPARSKSAVWLPATPHRLHWGCPAHQ